MPGMVSATSSTMRLTSRDTEEYCDSGGVSRRGCNLDGIGESDAQVGLSDCANEGGSVLCVGFVEVRSSGSNGSLVSSWVARVFFLAHVVSG